MLNSNFNKKLSLFKILFILREDEAKINKEFNYYNNKGYLNNHIKKFCKLEKSKDSVTGSYSVFIILFENMSETSGVCIIS